MTRYDDNPLTTLRTWISDRLRDGDTGRLDVNHYVLETYAEFLKRYLRGSSFRSLGDADDLVHSFLADHLSRDDFLSRWNPEGGRLRHWLIGCLKHYLLGLRRKEQRRHKSAPMGPLPESLPPDPRAESPDKRLDREFLVEIVRRALLIAEKRCRSRDLGPHWRVFLLHNYEAWPYDRVAGELDITTQRATTMNRTAKEQFQSAVRELLERDGTAPERVDDEIRSLLGRSQP